jgi:tetratricopeptide (TPR) repeat protein
MNKTLVGQLVKAVDEGIKIDPKDIELWKLKVLASFAERDYEGAVNAMDEIERGEKLEWFGSYLRQMISYADADDSEREEIRTSLKSLTERILSIEDGLILALVLDYVDEGIVALELLNRMAKLYPESTLILDSKFDLAASLGNREYAEQTVKMLEGRRAMLTHYEFDYAKLIEMRGDPGAALEHMLKLIGKDPENPVYLSYIGELFFKQNQCDSAMQYLEQSLEISPNNAPARFYRGHCRFDEGRYEEALNEFNEAATQEETNLLYMLWIGRSLTGLNQLLEAERSFTTVIDSFTAQNAEAQQLHDPANLPEAYFRRAEIKKLQNRRTEARQDYLKALELMPESVEYLTGYSIYLYENEILGECIDHVTQIENILGDKADPRLYFVRGLSYLKQNNRSEAISDLEHALKLGFAELSDSRIIGIREPAEIYERLGYLYRDIGKREQARKSLLTFLEKSTSISDRTRKEIQGQIDRI